MTQQTQWEYATIPLLIHATKQILDQWAEDCSVTFTPPSDA